MTVRSQRHLREFYGSDSSGEGQITLVPDLSLDFSGMTSGSDLGRAGITYTGGSLKTMYDSTGLLTYNPNNLALWSNDSSQNSDGFIWQPNANWTFSQPTGTLPNGTTGQLNRVVANTTSNIRPGNFSPNVNGGHYNAGNHIIISAWVRSFGNDPTTTKLWLWDNTSGPVESSVITLTTNWQRASFLFTSLNPAQNGVGFSLTGAVGTGIEFYGLQVEVATYETTARTYNPTTTSPYYGPRFDHEPAATVLNATELFPAAALHSSSGWVLMPNAAGTIFGPGGISFVSTGGYDGITYDLTNSIFRGRLYKVELTLNLVSGQIDFYLGVSGEGTPTNPSGTASTPGVQTISSIAYKNGLVGQQLHIRGGPAGVATITNISIKAYDAVSKGLLIEEVRTNLLIQSTFNHAGYSPYHTTLTLNAITSPDGTVNAASLLEDATTNAHIIDGSPTFAVTNGTTYTASVYVKPHGRTRVSLNAGSQWNSTIPQAYYDMSTPAGSVDNVGTGVTATIQAVNNGWYRLTYTLAANVTNNGQVYFQLVSSGTTNNYAGDVTKGVYIWGYQLEAGAFATSHIPTFSAAVARAVDNPTMTGTDFSDWYNPTEGTFVAVYDTFNPNTSMVSALNGGGSLNEWSPISSAPSSGNIVDYKLYTGGVQQAGITVSGLSINSLQKIAVAYKTNDFALVLNGAPSATDASGSVGNPDRLAFGSDGFGSYILNGHIKSFAYYRTRLSNDTLRSLTHVADPTLDLDLTRPPPSTVTFARASSGRYTDASGLVALALTDVPRIDYDPITLRPRGLLVEGQSTNLLLRSEDISSSPWVDFGPNTVTVNAAIAPDGTLTADRFQVTSYNGRFQQINISGSTAYTFTCYVKAAGVLPNFYTTLQCFDGAGAVNEGAIVISSGTYVGNGWYRHARTITSGAGDARMNVEVRGDGGNGGGDFYVWGMQVEQAAFATSYISTTSSQATRAADLASMTGSNLSSWFNASQGTFVVDWGASSTTGAASPFNGPIDQQYACWLGGTGNDANYGTSNITIGGTTSWGGSLGTALTAEQSAGKGAVAYNSTGGSLALNGVSSTASGAVVVGYPSGDFFIGHNLNGYYWNGCIKSIKFYNSRLSDAYLQELTSLPAATYYVDTAGNDSADGLSQGTAWQTIAKVNASHFQPGATIRFQGGQTFSGNIVCPSDRMTFNSYGTGQATISAGAGIGFRAVNKSSITVQNLIFVGNGITTNGGNGISIENNQSGNTKLFGPTISGCTVSQFGWTGIHVSGTNGTSGFNGVLISNCVAHDCTGNRLGSESGISVDSDPGYGILANGVSHLNVRITGCTAYNNTGTAGHSNWTGSGINLFETDGGVIEYCVAYNNGALGTNFSGPVGIWLADTKNCVIQFCESHHNKTNGVVDGGGFDIDGGCQNCIIQYCYSHDNYGSGYQLYSYEDSVLLQDSGNILRYCISENDGTHGLQGGIMVGTDSSREMIGIKVYNNTVYQSGSTSPAFWVYPGGNKVNAVITNNIFQSAGTSYLIYNSGGNVSGLVLDHNVYYAAGSFKIKWANVDYTTYASWRTASSQEAGNNGLTTDPLLTAPGAGAVSGRDLTSLSAYKIRSGSPAVNSGAVVSGAPAQDFYGDIVPLGGAYDRGAHELA